MAATQHRFSRDEFLARSLDLLVEEGDEGLRVARLVGELGVTRGSFYSHFENRAEFVRSLTDYWVHTSTQLVIADVEAMEGAPGERLFSLMRILSRQDHASRDLAVRNWASHEPEAASAVRKVERMRLTCVRRLFQAMGFEGYDLDTRTEILVTALGFEGGILVTKPRTRRLETLRHWYEFFTRP